MTLLFIVSPYFILAVLFVPLVRATEALCGDACELEADFSGVEDVSVSILLQVSRSSSEGDRGVGWSRGELSDGIALKTSASDEAGPAAVSARGHLKDLPNLTSGEPLLSFALDDVRRRFQEVWAPAKLYSAYRQQRVGGLNRSSVVLRGRTSVSTRGSRLYAYAVGGKWVDFCFVFVYLVFALSGVPELVKFYNLAKDCGGVKSDDERDNDEIEHWSKMGLVGLQAYRFYSGFNSATWLPYLLAMEGDSLWTTDQALFMGVCKLIYGLTILINPLMGRVGDHAVLVSHGIGRRLFCRLGLSLAAVGILACLWSTKTKNLIGFFFGITLWRLGEAITDVTTEAIIPEMIPKEQFQLASSLKSLLFLSGGLFGYVLLICMVNFHFDWLYYAYMVGMLGCALPGMLLLNRDNRTKLKQPDVGESFAEAFVKAYLVPMQYGGGYTRYSLATFVFLLGVSPMFFMLLIVRDLVGVRDVVGLQRAFSEVSIVFFVSAAFAAVLTAWGGVKHEPAPQISPADQLAHVKRRFHQLVKGQICFATATVSILLVLCFDSVRTRLQVFFVIAACFGFTFGCGYSLFTDGAWQVLPQDSVGKANAMGFNTMCRLLGVGIGNFLAGALLDLFLITPPSPSGQVYLTVGYVLMFAVCCCTCFVSAALVYSIDVSTVGGISPARAA